MVPVFLRKAWTFLKHDLWRINARSLPKGKWFMLRLLRVIVLAGRGFRDDKCQLRASALTFYSLLAIVPVVAMAFGISKGFPGIKNSLKNELRKALPAPRSVAAEPGDGTVAKVPVDKTGVDEPSPSAGVGDSDTTAPAAAPGVNQNSPAEKIIAYSEKLLDETSGGWVAGIGILVLFYTVIKVLGQIESSFNDIWGLHRNRDWGRRLADYFLVIFVGPLLLVFSSSVSLALQVEASKIIAWLGINATLASLLTSSLSILSWAVIWLLFSFIYIYMPNTKVRWSSAILAGVIAGSVFMVAQWAYMTFQVGVVKYNSIYGSLAVLPLFLIWLHLSWLVVLFGAEVSFAWQNVDTYEYEPDCLAASQRFKQLVSLCLMQLVVERFQQGKEAPLAAEMSHDLDTPIRLVNELLYELRRADLLRETSTAEHIEPGYLPARPIEKLTVAGVLKELTNLGTENVPLAATDQVKKLRAAMETFGKIIQDSESNLLLRELQVRTASAADAQPDPVR
jgi:membrane protein